MRNSRVHALVVEKISEAYTFASCGIRQLAKKLSMGFAISEIKFLITFLDDHAWTFAEVAL
ncbi:MAG: hypothetical protein NZL95_02260 [Chitinophagales bacterium]|nr:hypothetical protein [Chitinophagales bacterium]MDW8427356.1 hypothetical protein [Chitinophagales bacterium]